MRIVIQKNNHFIIILVILFFISGCDKMMYRDTGSLEGTISIGPLCPVETVPPDPGCLPTAETFKAYPVSVWTAAGRRKVAQLNPLPDGSYKIDLAPGHYLVVLDNRQSGIGGSNLPVEITINSQANTVLNISIDTGIR